jgi:general secretion pathway protein G
MKINQKTAHSAIRLSHAFTLVEMLLVLLILSALAAIVYPNLTKHSLRARITQTKSQLEIYRTALVSFEMDNDRFPKGANGLRELVQRPQDARNWRGPYLEKGIPHDAWGNDFIYQCPGKHRPDSYDLFSLGPDGIAGTEDDITNWQQGK